MKLFLAVAVLFVGSALGETFITTGGVKYEGTAENEPDGLKIITDDGIVKVPFTKLPPEVAAKYGYNPAAAAAFAADPSGRFRRFRFGASEARSQA